MRPFVLEGAHFLPVDLGHEAAYKGLRELSAASAVGGEAGGGSQPLFASALEGLAPEPVGMTEPSPGPGGDRGSEHHPGDPSDLARVSIPASNEVIDAALRLVVKLAEATVPGANGVSVSLERHGKLRTVAASNSTVLEMDRHQYESGEGPCVAAAAEGHAFHIESLAEEARWPTFVPEAIQQGIKSILSTPLIPGDRPVGALNIYSDAERAFGTSEQELAQLFATQAAGILADAGVADDERTALLADSLRSREVIAVAQGVLMERTGVSQEEAAGVLRRDARAAELTVRKRAGDIVRSTQSDDR